MQTLWSRVAQVRGSCRCPQCLSAGNGVARRATATATQRMPKYLTSSTLWYSGIFAAAATFDAGVKKQRREQWDLAIADVKQELELPAPATERQMLLDENDHKDTRDGTISFKPFDLSEERDVFRDVDPSRPKPRWPTNTGPELSVHRLPPESIYATDLRKKTAERLSLSPKKLANIEAAIELLQLNIFVELQQRNWSSEAAKAVPEQYAKYITQDLGEFERQLEVNRDVFANLMRADSELSNYSSPDNDTRLCSFAQENAEHKIKSVRDLNLSLQELFNQRTTHKLDTPGLLSKVSYNLSLCPFPPNLNTFNTLLLGFSRIQEHSLIEHVIRSLRKCHMRPNEVTLASILRHYTKTNESEKFVRWIELIRGKHNGLALARPDIHINEAGRSRLVRDPEVPGKVIQLPYATPYVFSAIIGGVIKFAGFETALAICKNMGLEGWGLCMSGLTPLLQNCADRADWASGSAVWSQIQALKAVSRRREGSNWYSERIKLDAFAAMLRLCSKCGQKKDFEFIWDQALSIHGESRDELVRLVKEEVAPKSESEAWPVDKAAEECKHTVTRSDTEDVLAGEDASTNQWALDEEFLHDDGGTQLQRTSEMLSELRIVGDVKDKQPSNEDRARRTLDPDSTAAQTRTERTPVKSAYRWPTAGSVQILEEQLYGNYPAGEELSEHELRERPMRIQA